MIKNEIKAKSIIVLEGKGIIPNQRLVVSYLDMPHKCTVQMRHKMQLKISLIMTMIIIRRLWHSELCLANKIQFKP